MFDKTGNVKRMVMRLLWVGVVLVSIKSILTDTGYDNGYQIAMSYRHLNNDSLFATMWEPHLSSAFAVDILMWLYHWVVPSFAGVNLYIQICGTLLFGLLCVPVYRTLKPYCNEYTAQFICMFLIVYRAKQTPFVEFANMQIFFSVLVFLCLVKYFENSSQRGYLYTAAIFMCLEVLSYPSCIISYIFAAVLLYVYGGGKLKDVIRFSVCCAVFGAIYFGIIVLQNGFAAVLKNISGMVSFDSHSAGKLNSGIWVNTKEFVIYIGWIAAAALVGAIICKAVKLISDYQVSYLVVFAAVIAVSEAVLVFTCKNALFHKSIYILPLLLEGIGFMLAKQLSDGEKRVFVTGVCLAAASAISVMMLTDLSVDTFLPYMVIGCMVSIMAISKLQKEGAAFTVGILVTVLFHRGIVVNGYMNAAQCETVFQMQNIIRNGPNVGIVADNDNVYFNRDAGPELANYTDDDDCVLVVTYDWIIDPAIFLFANGEIANPSVIDTPVYNEVMLDYYDRYPQKKPTVVAVLSPYGFDGLSKDSWIRKWTEDNYELETVGNYWKIYR